jgi:hypothetical protein
MRLELDMDEVCTILAALNHYIEDNQGEPCERTDPVHADATGETLDWEVMSSFDNVATSELYESIKATARRSIGRAEGKLTLRGKAGG